MMYFIKSLVGLAVCVLVLAGNLGPAAAVNNRDAETGNLAKLARVWGFTKYTHMAFVTGERCWDAELLALISIIRHADPEDVNDILYEWFLSLGDDGYDLGQDADIGLLTAMWQNSLYSTFGGESGYPRLRLHVEAAADRFRFTADTSWINEDYLGESLYAAFSRFESISADLDISEGPFGFRNESSHMFDFGNEERRLLGLFRLWNAMEYFYPNRETFDECWHEALYSHIPKMLEGTCRSSYILALASLTSGIHDGHLTFERAGAGIYMGDWSVLLSAMRTEFGRYGVPDGLLIEAGGKAVVRDNSFPPLEQGDAILGVNGVCAEVLFQEIAQYKSLPGGSTSFRTLVMRNYLIWSHTPEFELDILRGGNEVSVTVQGRRNASRISQRPYHPVNTGILDGNIGYVNPPQNTQSLRFLMREFEDADGLIIDLRAGRVEIFLTDYLLNERQPFVTYSYPLPQIPGAFVDGITLFSGGFEFDEGAYFYNMPVVVLINENVISWGETVAMSLRNAPNVTLMGTNTAGSNGAVMHIPLPGDIAMWFSSVGIFTPDGVQTHRVGIVPDIYVPRTIEGIREDKDCQLEAAIQFLLGVCDLG